MTTELQKLIEKNVVCLCDVLRGNMICRRHQLIEEIQAWAEERAVNIDYCLKCQSMSEEGDIHEELGHQIIRKAVPLEEFE